MATTVTVKGQVTIPKSVRDVLGIVPGSKVDFRQSPGGGVEIYQVGPDYKTNRFDRFRGHAGPGLTTDEIMAMTRGDD